MGNLVLVADSQRHLGLCQRFAGRPHEDLTTLRESFSFSQQIENVWGQANCAVKMMHPLLDIGYYGEAIRVGRQGVELTSQLWKQILALLARLTFSEVLRTVMAWETAEKTLTEVVSDFSRQEGRIFPDWAPAEQCALYASVGKWAQAYKYAQEVLQAREDKTLLPITFTSYYETEALLRGGDEELARAEVARLEGIVGNNKRYQLPMLRSQAILAQWDEDVAQAIAHFPNALVLAQAMGLPSEEWPIWGELGRLYGELGEREKAREAYGKAGTIIHRLADTIDDDGLREGFVTAVSTRTILQKNP